MDLLKIYVRQMALRWKIRIANELGLGVRELSRKGYRTKIYIHTGTLAVIHSSASGEELAVELSRATPGQLSVEVLLLHEYFAITKSIKGLQDPAQLIADMNAVRKDRANYAVFAIASQGPFGNRPEVYYLKFTNVRKLLRFQKLLKELEIAKQNDNQTLVRVIKNKLIAVTGAPCAKQYILVGSLEQNGFEWQSVAGHQSSDWVACPKCKQGTVIYFNGAAALLYETQRWLEIHRESCGK
jgi:hypothetical protein